MKEYIAIYRSDKTETFYGFEAENNEAARYIALFIHRTLFRNMDLVDVIPGQMIEVKLFSKLLQKRSEEA